MPEIGPIRTPVFPAAPRPAGDGEQPVGLEEGARQFEALLLAQLLRTAREAGSEGWLGAGEDQTASSAMELAEEQFARALAAQGGLGLAGLIVSCLDQESQALQHSAAPE